ncbi:MFS transporter [Bacillus gobiensis]|uniref:MFS transporter n=1 Tax=Bacillus gobiensis TaxID=1441095 RepID=UPI003D24DE6B
MNRLTIYLLALGVFFTGTAELVVGGILPVIADDLEISIALAGQLITTFSLAFAIGTPILVTLTSRMERKKVLVCSLVIFILGCFVSFASSNFSILMVARIILGISAGLFNVVALSSAVKLVSANKMGSAIGVIALGFGSAMALGVPIGIAIASWWSWQGVYAVLGVLSLLVMLGLIRLLPQIEGDAPVPFKQQFTVLRSPTIVSGFFASFFLCMSNSIMLTYLTPFFETILHLNTSGVGLMMLVLGVVGVIGSRLGGSGVDAWGTVRMISLSFLVSFGALAFLPMFTAILPIGLVLLTIWMMFIFMAAPGINSYFIQQAPQSSNFILGLNTSIIHLGMAIGAGLGGILVNSASTVLYHPWAASGTIALGLAAAIVSFSIRKRNYSETA